ncbi:hypothetical protein PSEUBRA_002751 [Kalmanozyma brasiliensis GHG001]|uniref:WW domain-containing protein n=1 Tax=Kalmanozyma brasiliensis (strain GHG001) TaxID=1365824 RepID=V5EWE3_KALBG|nr:uncharacterized protein PSEUBRA_002751 [Kalmanozyma brasiliensis GHG001]EST07658.1 hypothetical protein PSEUBRA_002751 [Kalmanozyma brasiliensis GHG001]
MKVALLCAIVFGAISVAASASQAVVDDDALRWSKHQRFGATEQKRSQKNDKKIRFKHDLAVPGRSRYPPFTAALIKRGESGAVAEIGENLASLLKGTANGGEKGTEAIGSHYASTSNANVRPHIPEAHPYPRPAFEPPRYSNPFEAHEPPRYSAPYPAPSPARDPALTEKLDKISDKLKKLKKNQVDHQQQIMMMEELQAKQMMAEHAAGGAAGAAAAGKSAKRGWGTGAMALAVGGGLAGGYGLTKLFDTKPSDSTTAYNAQDQAALQANGGAAQGSMPVDGAPQGQAAAGGAGAAADSDIAEGPYRVPNSNLVWLVDKEGQTHVLDPAQNYAEVPPPKGWQPPAQGGGGNTAPSSSGANDAAGSQPVSRNSGDQQADAGAGSAPGAQAPADGAANGPGPDSNTQSGADGNAPQSQNGAGQPEQGGGAPSQGGSNPKPVWDKSTQMWYVTSPKGVRFYIDDQTGYFINSQTGDVSDPKTGKIIYRGDQLMDNGGGNGASGQGQAGAGGPSAGANGQSGGGAPAGTGAGAGARGGQMRKRSLRHRKLEKRQYSTAAYKAASPALREQAKEALLRESSGATALDVVKKPSMFKTLGKGALGIGALAALVMGLSAYAHPNRPNTTPDNEYGLVPTSACDVYGQPIMRDFRGVLWNKSTYARVDMNDMSGIHACTAEEAAAAGQSMASSGGAGQQKRSLHDTNSMPAELVAAVKEDVEHDAAAPLQKRQMKALGSLLPSMSASGTMAVAGTVLITALYLHSIHQKKLQVLQDDYNSKFHSAGEAASSVGNAISTGANGQLFNPLTGDLIMVDQSTNAYYDSGSGEQVNPKTGMPFRYGDGGEEKKDKPVRLPLDQSGNVSGDSPEVQQAMQQWSQMTPQQQQQLMAQYGGLAHQILNSPDPNAALQAWSEQQGQMGISGAQPPRQQQ